MTLSITTFSITTFSIMTLSICDLYVTLSIKYTEHYNALHSAECNVLFIVILSVIMLNVVMLTVVGPKGLLRCCQDGSVYIKLLY
jgi:hypothetical protein